MDISYSMGGLIPLWILGAPFLGALISLVTMPTAHSGSDLRDKRVLQSSHQTLQAAGAGAVRM